MPGLWHYCAQLSRNQCQKWGEMNHRARVMALLCLFEPGSQEAICDFAITRADGDGRGRRERCNTAPIRPFESCNFHFYCQILLSISTISNRKEVVR